MCKLCRTRWRIHCIFKKKTLIIWHTSETFQNIPNQIFCFFVLCFFLLSVYSVRSPSRCCVRKKRYQSVAWQTFFFFFFKHGRWGQNKLFKKGPNSRGLQRVKELQVTGSGTERRHAVVAAVVFISKAHHQCQHTFKIMVQSSSKQALASFALWTLEDISLSSTFSDCIKLFIESTLSLIEHFKK